MSVNRYTGPIKWQEFSPYPMSEMLTAGAIKDKKDDEFNDLLDKSIFYLPAKRADQQEAQGISKQWESQLSGIADQHLSNPQGAINSLRDLKRKWTQFTTYGKGAGIVQGYQQEQQMLKDNQDAQNEYMKSQGKSGTSPDEIQLNKSYNFKVQKPTTQNPDGTWSQDQYSPVMPTYNYAEKAIEYGDKIKPDQAAYEFGLSPIYSPKDHDSKGKVIPGSTPIFYQDATSTHKYLAQEVAGMKIENMIKSDRQAMSHRNWKANLTGSLDLYNHYKNNDFQGQDEYQNSVQYKPSYVEDNLLNPDIINAAHSAGSIYAHDERDIKDFGLHENPLLDKTKEKVNPSVPVYPSPNTNIPKSTDFGNEFTQGERAVPLTQQEIEANMVEMGDPNPSNTKTIDRFAQPNELSEKAKNFLLGVSQYSNPDIYKKVKKGTNLTKEEQQKIYPQVEQMTKALSEDIQVNSRVIGLTSDEADNTNQELFGKKDNTVKNLGTGLAGNLTFYDKNTGDPLNLKELKAKYSDKEAVSVNGKFTAENPYSIIMGGDKRFTSPKQLFIGGDEYVASGPEGYIDSKTQSANTPENVQLIRDKSINSIYSLKFSPVPITSVKIYGEPVQIGFQRSPQNPIEGTYILNIKGKSFEFNTATEVENFIHDNVIK